MTIVSVTMNPVHTAACVDGNHVSVDITNSALVKMQSIFEMILMNVMLTWQPILITVMLMLTVQAQIALLNVILDWSQL